MKLEHILTNESKLFNIYNYYYSWWKLIVFPGVKIAHDDATWKGDTKIDRLCWLYNYIIIQSDSVSHCQASDDAD